MRRSHPRPTGPRRKGTKWRLPCAPSIFHPWRRNKTDRRSLARLPIKLTTTRPTKFSLSCDDAEPFHFSVKPDAVNDERNGADERGDRAREINRRAFHEIDPEAPPAHSERKQRREDDKNDVKSFKRHLTDDRIVPR